MKLKQKLEKMDAKISALQEKKEDIMRMIKEAEQANDAADKKKDTPVIAESTEPTEVVADTT